MNARRVSTRNNAYQHLETMKRNRAKRTKAREAVVEGVIPINLCVENGLFIKRIYFSGYTGLSDWATTIIADHPDAESFDLTPALMQELSEKEATSEIIVIAGQPGHNLSTIKGGQTLLIDRPSSPGNLGVTVRSCDSFGLDSIIISGHAVDPFDPKCIAASRGTVFTIPIVKASSNAEIIEFLNSKKNEPKCSVYGSSAQGNLDLREVIPSRRFVLIVGNETTGMAPFLHGLADSIVTIPTQGHSTSLNVACATSILLYELTKTREEPR